MELAGVGAVSVVLGYAVRKGVNFILGLLGVFVAFLLVLQALGYAVVDWAKLVNDAYGLLESLLSQQDLASKLEQVLPGGLVGIAGFMVGWKLGGKL
ncbi:FUN14 domain-containing protein [Thermofilum pendens]|uniref:FUN14 family protein n=1 Tax=Thermofilum pendens (strain DSM 2475 / Hrk 5) TaxID=368408 RepID=A1S1D3_THEPD|nr:FUN14 domain-containing protein [Thermofilum pendens]ABL79263.1 conserved hypothetical protein [Thermofilum pendens Hrk 5]